MRIRFAEPAGTVTTEISDPPPPPDVRPLVTVRPRADGAPDVTVTGGKARVRILGWDGSAEPSSVRAGWLTAGAGRRGGRWPRGAGGPTHGGVGRPAASSNPRGTRP